MKRVEIPVKWGTQNHLGIFIESGQWKLHHVHPFGVKLAVDINPDHDIWLRIISPLCQYKKPLCEALPQFRSLQRMQMRQINKTMSLASSVYLNMQSSQINDHLLTN